MTPQRRGPPSRRSPSTRSPRTSRASGRRPTTDARLKKRIVRTLIHEAVADLDDETAEIVLTLHWVGGAHTEHRLPRRRRGQRTSTPADVVEAVRTLALIARDDVIAGVLNRNGLKTGHGNRWTRERVTSLRSSYRIPVFRAAQEGAEPWLNLSQAAALVGVAPRTLRLAAERGEIDAQHPLADGPWVFRRAALEGPPPEPRPASQRPDETPRGIGPRPAKPLRINNIARCAF